MEGHIIVPIPITGGQVVILNANPTISAEDIAMLQALYSRDPNSIFTHLKRVGEHSSQKKTFMNTYYVGYGHQSIGDCAPITFFIEGISIIAAKAIQDSRLYSGQEVSTRYVDYSKQPFLFGGAVAEHLRKFYVESFPVVEKYIASNNPTSSKQAVKAATFDVLRGFLPAGAMTSCSWTTNIRQANDHLMWLRSHPLLEVQEIAKALTQAMRLYAPSSVIDEKKVDESWVVLKTHFLGSEDKMELSLDEGSAQVLDLLRKRNPKDFIPNVVDSAGTLIYHAKMDYGSYRDLQRHRSIIQNSPLPTIQHGFESWYINSLPDEVKEKAIRVLSEFEEQFQWEDPARYYTIPLGYKVPIYGKGGLGSMMYISELRSAPTVHPTLQTFAKKMGEYLESKQVPVKYHKGPVVHLSEKRGSQTITLL